MAKRYSTVDLTDYRTVLDTSGDLAVGAYARRQRRRRILIALAGLALVAGAYFVYSFLSGLAGTDSGRRVTVRVRCGACQTEAELRLAPGTTYPINCPKCKERAARPLWKCRECNAMFPAPLGSDRPLCPNCKSPQVGSAATP